MATRAVKAAAKQIASRNGQLPKRRSQRCKKPRFEEGQSAPKFQIHYEVSKLPPGSLVLYKGRPMLLLRHSAVSRDSAELLFPDGPWCVQYKWLTIPPGSETA